MYKKIAIFCGGPSSEHEVSLSSAKTIFEHLDKEKYEVVVCYITKKLNAKIIRNEDFDFIENKSTTPLIEILQQIKKENFFAFIAAMHGEFGEDGKLQALLEFEKIPYCGSNVESSALCTDKMRTMMIASAEGMQIPKTTFLTIPHDLKETTKIKFPAIVKPNNLGSSVGLGIVNTQDELHSFAKSLLEDYGVTQILVQEIIHGIELSCGTLEDKDGKFTFLPPIEIHPEKSELFDYEAKYIVGASKEITPPISISKSLSDKISEQASQIHIALGCKTFTRSDFMVRKNEVFYLETNTLPGMTVTSLLPQEAAAIGISFPQLLDFIISNS